MRTQNHFDAIVIGSGMSGGWAAKELTEKGLKTLVLERGRNVEHIKDYPTAHTAPWEFPYAMKATREDRERQPIQSTVFHFGQSNKHFFIDDSENPYIQEKPFNWIRGTQVGGKSLLWSRHVFRWSDLDFEANLKEGVAIDWPIRYKDIEPWYDYVESFIGVSGENAGLSQLPDQIMQPPHEMNCVERHCKQKINAHYPDRHMISARVAVLTQPHLGRGACMSRNMCSRGCPYGAYFSSNSSTLPAAAKTGNMTLRPHSIVHSLIYDKETNRAVGVNVIDSETMETHEFFAEVIFMCASTLGTTQILMNSASDTFPDGFANSSGVLGHYLMDHLEGGFSGGKFRGFDDKYYYGSKPNGMYIPRFRNVSDRHPDFTRGYAFECYSSREHWGRGMNQAGVGSDFKDKLSHPGDWTMVLVGYAECLPYKHNKVTLDKNEKDKWGLPVLSINMDYGENENKMLKDMMKTGAEMLEAAGLEEIWSAEHKSIPGAVIHEMGTARMGRDPKTSVLNAYNQCHDVPNVFITDGSCMTSSACQNPSLTYMALTARACHYAVEELKKGRL